MTKTISIVMLVLIMTLFIGYIDAVISPTLAFSQSEGMSEMRRKTANERLAAKQPHPIPMGDPINDPKPNCKKLD